MSQKIQTIRPTIGMSVAAPGPDVSSLKAKRLVRLPSAAGALHLTQRSGRTAPSFTTMRLPRTNAPLPAVPPALAAGRAEGVVAAGAVAVRTPAGRAALCAARAGCGGGLAGAASDSGARSYSSSVNGICL